MRAWRVELIFQSSFRRFPQSAGSLMPIRSPRCMQREQYVKRQLVSLGLNEFGVRGDDPTPTASVTGG
jgi:hypothetical protein